jgi:endonuclease/exonuclease/phosphatase family metal-dependent hydrolase
LVETRNSDLQPLAARLPGYVMHNNEVRRAGRAGQGLALLVRDEIKLHVKPVRRTAEVEILWFEMDGCMCGIQGKVMLGVCYIPPANRMHPTEEIEMFFSALCREVAWANSRADHVLLMGDFNAHLGDKCEVFDRTFPALVDRFPEVGQPRMHVGCSAAVNTAGTLLLELSVASGLVAVCGRGRGDCGEPSCRGATRPDHFLCSADVFTAVQRAWVSGFDQLDLFDHKPVCVEFLSSTPAPRQVLRCGQVQKLQWRVGRSQAFCEHFEANAPRIAEFEQAISLSDCNAANGALCALISEAAHHAGMLGMAWVGQPPPGAVKRAPWFDVSCREAKRRLREALASGEARHLSITNYCYGYGYGVSGDVSVDSPWLPHDFEAAFACGGP